MASGKDFCGGGTRLAEHITGKGVIMRCPCDNAAFLQLKAELIAKAGEKDRKGQEKAAATAVDQAAVGLPTQSGTQPRI